MKRALPKSKGILLGITILFVLSLLFSSCSSSSKSVAPQSESGTSSIGFGGSVSYDEAVYDAAAPAEAPNMKGLGQGEAEEHRAGSNSELMSQRKIIMEGDVSLETKDFDSSIIAFDELVADYGGFVESRAVAGKRPGSRALRSARFVIRVPSDSFDDVLLDMNGIGTVLESNSKGTDITDSYTDFEVRLKTLKVQEETLLDILSKSTELEDVIKLESRISEVRYEIERIENQLRNYDRLIAYSRISVHIQEVDDVTETVPPAKTLSERIATAFTQSVKNFRLAFEDFVVWIVASWISLIFFIGIVVVILIMVRKKKNRHIHNNTFEKTEKHPKIEEEIEKKDKKE
ncbi:MAG: DUF4349 domain-containing protein [Clostridiaceae bacterium]|nr:DUF4349 domain-containing protein [Clostridiaceae bacterium]